MPSTSSQKRFLGRRSSSIRAAPPPSCVDQLPQDIRGRLSDELIDELLAGARSEQQLVGVPVSTVGTPRSTTCRCSKSTRVSGSAGPAAAKPATARSPRLTPRHALAPSGAYDVRPLPFTSSGDVPIAQALPLGGVGERGVAIGSTGNPPCRGWSGRRVARAILGLVLSVLGSAVAAPVPARSSTAVMGETDMAIPVALSPVDDSEAWAGIAAALAMKDMFQSASMPLYARIVIGWSFGGLGGLAGGSITYNETHSGGSGC
jgi:hypothetical protein